MGNRKSYYLDGTQIRAGDRVTLAGRRGVVRFVLDGSSAPTELSMEMLWFKKQFKNGFLLEVDGLGSIFMDDGNEDLLRVAHS